MSEIDAQTPRLWNAGDLRAAEQPRWLAKGRLPRAAISLLVGDEGIGKSLLWVWLVAAITTGRALPEFGVPARRPDRVIVVATEDDWSTTVLPRLEVADADLSRISVICTEDDGSGAPIFPRDLYLITEAEPRPALVVVDAWLDTVPGNLSVKDPQQARRALHPWKEVATITDAAVLLLTHTNRVDSGNARDKYGATGELRKKARLTLFAQQDDDGNLVVGPEKANTTGSIAASTFQIDPILYFNATDEHDGTVPLLRYIGESDRTAREHITDRHQGEHGDDREERTAAENWVEDYLTEHSSAPSAEVKVAGARALKVSEKTISRAASKLKVVSRSMGFPRVTHWSLPDVVTVVDGSVVSEDTRPNQDPMSEKRVLTVPTGDDLHKPGVPTGGKTQSGHPKTDGHNDVPTGHSELCRYCGHRMSMKSDRRIGAHESCQMAADAKAASRRQCPTHNEPIGRTGKCIGCVTDAAQARAAS